MKHLYLDHNATCPLRDSAWEALLSARQMGLGNPGSAHFHGQRARHLLDDSRERLAGVLACESDEIVFTSGGTESNALALQAHTTGIAAYCPTEHPSVLRQMSNSSATTPLPIDGAGHIKEEAVEHITPNVGFVTVALANHETGATQNLAPLVVATRNAHALFHSDACQALGRIPLSFRDLGVDLLSLSAHKVGGPVGVGALLVRKGLNIPPLFLGGGQEAGLRPGTEAVGLIASFVAAAEEAVLLQEASAKRHAEERATLLEGLRALCPDLLVNTPLPGSISNTLNISFPGRSGPGLVHRMDLEGVSLSHGSACASGSLEPSPVLLALGANEERAGSALRVSFGPAFEPGDLPQLLARFSKALQGVTRRQPSARS